MFFFNITVLVQISIGDISEHPPSHDLQFQTMGGRLGRVNIRRARASRRNGKKTATRAGAIMESPPAHSRSAQRNHILPNLHQRQTE